MSAQSVGSAVARRSTAEIEAQLNGHVGWLDLISPSHMPARQLVALAVAELRKDDKLAAAAQANPSSFMVAVAECARLGLVPGDKYWLTGFNDRNAPGGMAVVGMVGYQGAMELAYRTGEVESIHCEVVRARDYFKWIPTAMRVPEHRLPKNEHGQEGLVDQADRGPLTGVYAYARMTNGGISQCVVMPRSEVLKHREVAKTDKFWGPPWPAEGPWTPAMWEKTGILSLADYLPDSPEYLKAKLAQQARIAEAPVPPDIAAEQARQQEAERTADAPDLGDDKPANGGRTRTIAGALAENEPRVNRKAALDQVSGLFDEHQVPGPARLVLARLLANPDGEPLAIKSAANLTNDQVFTLLDQLRVVIGRAGEQSKPVHDVLLAIARAAGWEDPADAAADPGQQPDPAA